MSNVNLDFIQLLRETGLIKIDVVGWEDTCYEYRNDYLKSYLSKVETSVNCFGFSTKDYLEQIFAEKDIAETFAVICMHFVKTMANLCVPNYWDKRDKLAVTKCKQISDTSEFKTLYSEMCSTQIADDICYGIDINKNTTLGENVGMILLKMHPTCRQTFCGLVLSFLMQYRCTHKLSKAVLDFGILSSVEVRFPLI